MSRPVPRKLPDALVVGPMKAGTTWLHGYLQARGDVCVPEGVKETFFFDRNWGKSIDWYGRHFRHYDALRHVRVMEVGASYFHEPEAPRRIVGMLGSIDILIMVRHPVERAWSHYRHLLRMGYTRQPLAEALCEFPEILEASRYSRGISRWAAAFPEGRITILRFEQMRSEPERFLRQLCEALGLADKAVDHARLQRNEAAAARSLLVAKGARSVARSLRARQLYFVVNGAKSLGIKGLVFGKASGSSAPLQGEDEALLQRRLARELETFEAFGC